LAISQQEEAQKAGNHLREGTVKVTEYNEFVRRTNQFADKPKDVQRAIALYGLVGEIGSLVAAVKKKILAEGGETNWNQPNDEITEELGDALWYCFASAQIINDGPFDILANDIDNLRREVGGTNERARIIATALDPATRSDFLEAAKAFPLRTGFVSMTINSLPSRRHVPMAGS
jgi:NTP pyrophosphatase (non-canonical NTP hydrolase)